MTIRPTWWKFSRCENSARAERATRTGQGFAPSPLGGERVGLTPNACKYFGAAWTNSTPHPQSFSPPRGEGSRHRLTLRSATGFSQREKLHPSLIFPLHGGRVLERCVHGRSNGRQRAPKRAAKLFGHECVRLSPIRISQHWHRPNQMLGHESIL